MGVALRSCAVCDRSRHAGSLDGTLHLDFEIKQSEGLVFDGEVRAVKKEHA
jgi:hypothetical protein